MQRNIRAMVAMLFVGLAIFSGLYSTQAMLPTFVDELGFTPTEAALTVSAATGALALCVVPLSILSERFGRGRLLVISAVLATILAFMVPLVGDNVLAIIAIRALQGAVLAGAPAVAMAWLSEELDEDVLPRAMGLYIAGNTLGGLTGRLIPTGLLEFTGWRGALLGAAVVSSFFAVLFIILLPKQRNFQPKQLRFKSEIRAMVNHWRNPQTGLLFVFALLGMGAFVSMYNFITFRLIDRFGLPVTLAGLVFLMYLMRHLVLGACWYHYQPLRSRQNLHRFYCALRTRCHHDAWPPAGTARGHVYLHRWLLRRALHGIRLGWASSPQRPRRSIQHVPVLLLRWLLHHRCYLRAGL